jgi:hypothetical protein
MSELNYQWSLTTPNGSSAVLSSVTTVSSTFTPDVVGEYQVKLIVNDGTVNSVPKFATILVLDQKPLVANISATVNPVASGKRLLYSITVSNVSILPVEGVNVSFQVPTVLQFDGVLDAEPDAALCNGDTICTPGETVVWSLGTLQPGTSKTIELNSEVLGGLADGSLVSLSINISADFISSVILQKAVSVYNNSVSKLTLGASKDPVIAGGAFNYQLDLGNIGETLSITSTHLWFYPPTGLTVELPISDNGIQHPTGEIEWIIRNLSAGNTLHREVSVTVDEGVLPGEILKARAEVTHDGGLIVDGRTEHAITVVADTHPLNIQVGTTNNPVSTNSQVLYSVAVGNSSESTVEDVNVLFRVPEGIDFDSQLGADPDAMGCNGDTICTAGEEVVWPLGALIPGASRTIDITATVLSGVVSGALLSAPMRTTAAGLNSKRYTKTVQVYNSPSAQLTLAASTSPVAPGDSFTYQLNLSNIQNTLSITSTHLWLYLPAGVTAVLPILDNGTLHSTGEIEWKIGNLSAGNTLQREVSVTLDSMALPGEALKAQAEVTHDGGVWVDGRAEYIIIVK